MHKLCLTSFLLLFWIAAHGQELNCKVVINADQVQTTDRAVFKDMERALTGFLNTRKWSTDNYKNYEKINCTLFLNISKMPSIGNFTANAQITSARPIYNTNYETVVLNFADREWEFEYIESQPLEYNDNNYISNLTSMLAYYAYIVLGMDSDSFSELGGTPFYQKALNVVNNAQSSNRTGWQALGSNRNRYSLIENLNNPQMVDLRKNTYRYHRMALDTFDKTPDQSRETILEALKNVKKVWGIYPTSILVTSFFDAKATELVNVFSEGSLQVRREAYDILTSIDSKRNIYQKIISN
jgi:Fe-S-cluster formation regulator IscX/YfhJ